MINHSLAIGIWQRADTTKSCFNVLPLSCSSILSAIFGHHPLHSLSWLLCRKLKNFSTKWQSPWRIVELNSRITLQESFFLCQMKWFVPQLWSFAHTLGYFVWSSVHCCLSSTLLMRPLVGLPRKFLHSLTLFRPFSHSALLFLLLSKTQFQKVFSLNAGALSLWNSLPQYVYGEVRVSRKEWPVAQLTEVYNRMRMPRNLDGTLVHSRSLIPRSKNVWTQKPELSKYT